MIILCDVDNCISNDTWRSKFINWHRVGHDERFHEYHMAASLDEARNLDLIRVPKARVFFLTAMPERYAHIREAWMRQYRIDYERILYRENGDHRHSVELKRSMVRRLREEGVPLWECIAAYDDRRAVVEMFKEESLPGKHIQIHDQEHYFRET